MDTRDEIGILVGLGSKYHLNLTVESGNLIDLYYWKYVGGQVRKNNGVIDGN